MKLRMHTLWRRLLIFLVVIGLSDAFYLTYEHYANVIPPCAAHAVLIDCGKVLRSDYATVFGVPLAGVGAVHYFVLLLCVTVGIIANNKNARFFALMQSTVGFIASLYFVYLQVAVIKAFCLYCLVSAATSTAIFLLSFLLFFWKRDSFLEEKNTRE